MSGRVDTETVNDLLLVGLQLCPGALVMLKPGANLGCGASHVLCVPLGPSSTEGSVYPAGARRPGPQLAAWSAAGAPGPFRVWGPGLWSPPAAQGAARPQCVSTPRLCLQLWPPPWK